ncbi:hypothetical protein [Aquamicrobium soli]|uniref:Uncharacterized protein n=1 Tax=Aquamicrobium soli TaxID=1811518 RepID=A0ABV7KBY9_9HYPH
MFKYIGLGLVILCLVMALVASFQDDYARGTFWIGLAIINQINTLVAAK